MGRLIAFLIFVILAIVAIVFVVIPIIGLLLGIGLLIGLAIVGFGFVTGFFIGLKNFYDVLTEAHQQLP